MRTTFEALLDDIDWVTSNVLRPPGRAARRGRADPALDDDEQGLPARSPPASPERRRRRRQ
jgi:hypothetical protein